MKVAIVREFLGPDGKPAMGDLGLPLLSRHGGIEWEFLPQYRTEIQPEDLVGVDVLVLIGSVRFSRLSLQGADRLCLVARWGVGYDKVDVEACTEAGVAVTITPDGPTRGVAFATLAMLLALATRLPQKDRITREGRWRERTNYPGAKITGQVLGSVGLGRNAREMFRLASGWQMRFLAVDPWADQSAAAALGVQLTDLPTLLRLSDFLTVHCPLTPQTANMINAETLAQMKETAFLINMARGGIVDEGALASALQSGRLAGAGVDVFVQEPPPSNHPLLGLDSVILSPHALGHTAELFEGNGRGVAEAILALARGERPPGLLNQAVLEHPRLRARMQQA